ncbi:MAG: hypothetical protein ACFHVJ_04895 [Aestuariibacter sp.]
MQRLIILLSFCAVLLCSNVIVAQENAQLKMVLLERLANEGNVDARRELAKMAVRSSKSGTNQVSKDILQELAVGAQHGNMDALRQLAHLVFHSKMSYEPLNALINTLYKAALLGDMQAAFEIIYLQQVSDNENQTISVLFYDAYQQLMNGQLIACSELQLDCHDITSSEWLLSANESLLNISELKLSDLGSLTLNNKNDVLFADHLVDKYLIELNKYNKTQTQTTASDSSWEAIQKQDRLARRAKIALVKGQEAIEEKVGNAKQLQTLLNKFNQLRKPLLLQQTEELHEILGIR